jgi:hypothetical protein
MQFAHTSGAEQMSGGHEHGVKTARSSQFPAAAGRPQVGRGPDAAAESRGTHEMSQDLANEKPEPCARTDQRCARRRERPRRARGRCTVASAPAHFEECRRRVGWHSRSGPSAQPTAFATTTARNDAERPAGLQSLQAAPAEENAGVCYLRPGSRTTRSSCAACEPRLRTCGASARNLRVSMTESSMWLDAPTFEGVDAKGGLPTVARSRFRRAEVGGPEQRQLEPIDRLDSANRRLPESRVRAVC